MKQPITWSRGLVLHVAIGCFVTAFCWTMLLLLPASFHPLSLPAALVICTVLVVVLMMLGIL